MTAQPGKNPTMRLTPVSYGLLAYLAQEPMSAYDLTRLMRFSGVRLAWPRTESRLYKEPHNLEAHGLVDSTVEHTGRRKRTVYSITPAGRAALSAWLSEPGGPASTEHEAMLKVFLADFGTPEQLRAQLSNIRAQLKEGYEEAIAFYETVLENGYDWPERAHLSRLVTRHWLAVLGARAGWLAETEREVASWSVTTGVVAQPMDEERELLRELRAALARFEEPVSEQ